MARGDIQTDENGKRYIDMTPTFEEATDMCLAVLEMGNEKGKELARDELRRYARQYDNLIAQVKAQEASKT